MNPSPSLLVVSGDFDPETFETGLLLPGGRVVTVPTAMLRDMTPPTDESVSLREGDGDVVIPVVEERLHVTRRVVETGRVLLRKTVQEFEAALDEPLAVRTFDIERILLNQPVDTAPGVRHEGETTVYPLVEEQLILTKQLVLKEEIRVTRRDTERRDTQVVTLRREHLDVQREKVPAAGSET